MAKATLTIEDSESPGHVNINFAFEPHLDDSSSAQSLMVRVLGQVQETVGQEAFSNIAAGVTNAQENTGTGS